MKKRDQIFTALQTYNAEHELPADAGALVTETGLDRSTVSRYLNQLVKAGRVQKTDGRPVRFVISGKASAPADQTLSGDRERYLESAASAGFEELVGALDSLQIPIQQAKAAMMYPPKGLHTLLLGETGVGKSMFAQHMHDFAVSARLLHATAPFVRFNCADYADNPQLVMGQIFGVKKGAYTGADKDRDGLLHEADGGVLFLDEVHRLPPQGQEMLFTFIDTGRFRKLGETGREEEASVRIVAATTEEPGSFLLRTFTRRIPMVITLPALRDRSMQERFSLIEHFIRQESKRIGKSIWINKNSVVSFLLYECPNNIGQLRSDIQLACAKAFLNFKSTGEPYMLINQSDLPQHVKRGLMRLKENRDELDYLLNSHDDLLKFHYGEADTDILSVAPNEEQQYYAFIERKIEDLRQSGMDQQQIQEILAVDIDDHFQQYLDEFPSRYKKDELKKIVDGDILRLTAKLLSEAGRRLNRTYDDKIEFALALHLSASVERIKQGQTIYHPNLNRVRAKYADAFLVAMEVAKEVEQYFDIQIPLDEIGYLTMFISADPGALGSDHAPKVGVLVIMHGASTASSMVQVANALIGSEAVRALDMPLSMPAEQMYDLARDELVKLDQGRGILLMVDMGSLMNFGTMAQEETGVHVKTVDMVSTPLVIEAGRKALLGRDLYEIYDGCRSRLGKSKPKEGEKTPRQQQKRLIVTACFTGEGAAARLRGVIDQQLKHRDYVEVKSLNILNRGAFLRRLDEYKRTYRVLAVVGTMDVPTEDIPFISAVELLGGHGLKRLQAAVDEEVHFMEVGQSLRAHLQHADGAIVSDQVLQFLDAVSRRMDMTLSLDVKTGVLLHMGFMIDKLLVGEPETTFDALEAFKEKNPVVFHLVREELQTVEKWFDVSVGEHETGYISRMLIENAQKTKKTQV